MYIKFKPYYRTQNDEIKTILNKEEKEKGNKNFMNLEKVFKNYLSGKFFTQS